MVNGVGGVVNGCTVPSLIKRVFLYINVFFFDIFTAFKNSYHHNNYYTTDLDFIHNAPSIIYSRKNTEKIKIT